MAHVHQADAAQELWERASKKKHFILKYKNTVAVLQRRKDLDCMLLDTSACSWSYPILASHELRRGAAAEEQRQAYAHLVHGAWRIVHGVYACIPLRWPRLPHRTVFFVKEVWDHTTDGVDTVASIRAQWHGASKGSPRLVAHRHGASKGNPRLVGPGCTQMRQMRRPLRSQSCGAPAPAQST